MGRKTTNLAELYLTTHKVAGVSSIVQRNPDNVIVTSDELSDSPPAILGLNPPTEGKTLELEVEIDDTDTNGQAALSAAKLSRALVTGVVYYPYGKSTGADKFSGSVYVKSSPELGSTGNSNKARKGKYVLTWSSEPTQAVES
jgi:hypothetical protein